MKKRKELNALLSRNLKFKKPFLVKSKGYVNIKNMDTLDLENNLSSASSLEDLDLGENIKKGSGFFAKMCSICLVFLLFLSLILSCTIILMHMETKLEIRNLAQRFKQVEYQNLAVNKENIYLKSNIKHNKNDSFQHKFAKYQNITFQNFETKLHSSDGSSLLQKSLTLMGSDLGRLKAEISGMKSILTSFKGKFASANGVIPKNNGLVPLLMSHVWNPSINETAMSSQDPL